ncbi:hypothetical protein ACFW5X_28340 [Streptomyces albogriseolus]|uniref:hypothetical protein n=1 Tax=Streptomyces albogriseolus TaxID=1887 RepID=UPI0036961184
MTGPRVWLDNGDGWQELTGVKSITLEECRRPLDWDSATLDVKVVGLPHFMSAEMAADYGLIPQPQPTPEERALAILAPHLACCPLYRGDR